MYLLRLMRIYWAPALYPYWARQCWKDKLTLFRSHDPRGSYSIIVPRWGKWAWRDEPYVQGHQQVHGRANAQTPWSMSFRGSLVFVSMLVFFFPSTLGSVKNLLSSVEIQGRTGPRLSRSVWEGGVVGGNLSAAVPNLGHMWHFRRRGETRTPAAFKAPFQRATKFERLVFRGLSAGLATSVPIQQISS